MSRYTKQRVYFKAATTSGTTLFTDPIDVSHFERFCIVYQNSGAAFTDLQVQGALDSSGTAANTAPNWAQIPTATLQQPSALGATATVVSSPIDNCYNWIRITGRPSVSATAGFASIHIGGYSRY